MTNTINNNKALIQPFVRERRNHFSLEITELRQRIENLRGGALVDKRENVKMIQELKTFTLKGTLYREAIKKALDTVECDESLMRVTLIFLRQLSNPENPQR